VLNKDNLSEFWDNLFAWFEDAKRDYPWRNTTDPYAVLLAEKLLQQTMARDYVVDTYCLMLEQYPTVNDLANADIGDLETIIKPLGFTFRAKHIKSMAQEIVKNHKCIVPNSFKDLLHLTGVGHYCARAVMSFAFGEDVAVVDTNVARFLYRIYGITEPITQNPSRNKILNSMADSLIPKGKARDYNLAILDLCAAICKSRNPLCENCPVNTYCLYGSEAIISNAT
jgi:A/G-specific adenine glycosylase